MGCIMDNISMYQNLDVICHECSAVLCNVRSFDYPLKPNVDGVFFEFYCMRCKTVTSLKLINGKGEKYSLFV